MFQEILLGVIVIIAVFYMARFLYNQVKGGKDTANCDKCLPKESMKEKG